MRWEVVGGRSVHALRQGNGKRTQHSLSEPVSRRRARESATANEIGSGLFLGHVGRFRDWRGVTRRARLFEATRPSGLGPTSLVIPPIAVESEEEETG
jgi:hypothetical protein